MITAQQIQDEIASIEHHRYRGTTVIGCVLTLKNGHAVIGHSACAHPDEFDLLKGISVARAKAEGKIAELLSYKLRGENGSR